MPRCFSRRVGLHRRDHEVGVDAVGDERLRAVDDVVVVLADRAGRHRRQVRADARLGHRERRDQRAVGDARQPALGLLRRAVLEEVGQADVVVQRDAEPGGRHAGVGKLLAEDLVEAEVIDAEPAVLLRDRHREHALVGGLLEQLPIDDALLVPALGVGRDLLGHEAAHALAVVDVLGLEDVAAHRVARYRFWTLRSGERAAVNRRVR